MRTKDRIAQTSRFRNWALKNDHRYNDSRSLAIAVGLFCYLEAPRPQLPGFEVHARLTYTNSTTAELLYDIPF